MLRCCLILLSLCSSTVVMCQSGVKTSFDKGWKFFAGDDSTAWQPQFNDASWQNINLPHDWSIEGDFSDKHNTTFNQGALPAGIGWYRKTFQVPIMPRGKQINILFDGVYRNSEVWINGHYLGKRPNGYISFRYELTPYLKYGKEKNIIAVRVNNSLQPNSRWYTGSGIYRRVWLEQRVKDGIREDDTFISTVVDQGAAAILIQTGLGATRGGKYRLYTRIIDSTNRIVAKAYMKLDGNADQVSQTIKLQKPVLWSPSRPYLYKVIIQLQADNIVADEFVSSLGIRYFNFSDTDGFFFNGKPMKILGVCMHHDLGALGAAVSRTAIRRQLQILKDMGCNAIRTAHNPPAPELLDLCDQMGFLVLDEAFDMWKKKKNKYDYNIDFDEWHRKDLEDMVKRDRNHPSVFMWSIGNEIREQFDSSGIAITRELVEIVKSLDPTRPVTCALTENVPEKNFIYQSKALDVLGFNYKHKDYPELRKRFPGESIIATETASALATRGYYEMPSDSFRIWPPDSKSTSHGNADLTASAYDNTFAYWGGTHEQTWRSVKMNDFISGIFVWSGFDFLGEPVPYQWPARSSYYGIVDLAGFPKDVYYMYQSEWTTNPVLHIFPHWNWTPGQLIDVWAYYSQADEVELFLNGVSLGTKRKDTALHVMWRVPFVPGVLKAISRSNGKAVLSREISTAGMPRTIELKIDNKQPASGEGLYFVKVSIKDGAGTVVPDAAIPVSFSISGPGTIVAVDNGLPTSHESFKAHTRTTYNGLCLVVVKASGKVGDLTIRAEAKQLQAGSIRIRTH